MLDDLKLITQRDAQDTLGAAQKQQQQLTYEFQVQGNADFHDIRTIVCAGMGNSALAAMFIRTWLPLTLPLEVLRDYDMPVYVDEHTLFIAVSYSGDTEETLSSLKQAEARNAQVIVIAGGGELQRRAEQKDYAFVHLPKVAQTRYTLFYSLRALLQVLTMVGVIRDDFREQLSHAAHFLDESITEWAPTKSTKGNLAKQVAQELIGKSIVVYSGPKLYPAAYKWKINFNESAKHVAWVNQIPESSHNEFMGWSKQPVDKPYAVVDLRSPLEHVRIQKRFVVTERLLSGMRPAPIVIVPQGTTILEQLLWLSLLGDFVGIYLALLNGVNPASVELVEKFKKALEE